MAVVLHQMLFLIVLILGKSHVPKRGKFRIHSLTLAAVAEVREVGAVVAVVVVVVVVEEVAIAVAVAAPAAVQAVVVVGAVVRVEDTSVRVMVEAILLHMLGAFEVVTLMYYTTIYATRSSKLKIPPNLSDILFFYLDQLTSPTESILTLN